MLSRRAALLGLGSAFLVPGVARAEPGDGRAATILVKALSFDLDLESRVGDALTVLVLFKAGDRGSAQIADSWTKAFSGLGDLKIKDVPIRTSSMAYDPAATAEAITKLGVEALLVCDGLDGQVDEINALAARRKIITMGTRRSMVERGLVLGTFVEADRPRVIVNMTTAARFGIRFSSSLLRVAVLVK